MRKLEMYPDTCDVVLSRAMAVVHMRRNGDVLNELYCWHGKDSFELDKSRTENHYHTCAKILLMELRSHDSSFSL
eukprot:scaffold1469_cov119-Cylindrotheca_fusiformis.AAC.6